MTLFGFLFKSDNVKKGAKDFQFESHPSYAVIAERDIDVDLDCYFSGDYDGRVTAVRLFDTCQEALQYLNSHPCPEGNSFLLYLDQDKNSMEATKNARSGFGSHIVKAVDYYDYFSTTRDVRPMSPDKVRVVENPHYKKSNPLPAPHNVAG